MDVDCPTLTYKPTETTVTCDYPSIGPNQMGKIIEPLHGVRKYELKLSKATLMLLYRVFQKFVPIFSSLKFH